VEWSISLLVLVTGALGGAAFALAGGLSLGAAGRPGSAAGLVVAADHAGACLGALLTGILLVPVLGTATAAVILAIMKLASAALLAIGKRTGQTCATAL
jgi:spermidine synthase